MRIVFIVTGLDTGGAEMMLLKLVSRLLPEFQTHVFSLSDVGEIGMRMRNLGVPVEHFEMNALVPNPMRFLQLVRRLRALKPHIVQTWLYHADFVGTLAALIARVPATSWNIRCSALDSKGTPFTTRLIIRLLSGLSSLPDAIVVNAIEGMRAHESAGYRAKRWEVIPNGFDLDSFHPDLRSRALIRRELNLGDDDIVFGLVARYHPMKDHANFLHAAALISDRSPKVRCVLVGNQVTSKNTSLQGLIKDLRLTEKVRMIGERRDIPAVMASLDCLISSSAWGEGFPNVIAEAMACGIPCIVTDVGDSAQIVGNTGWVAPPGAPKRLAEAMSAFLDLRLEERLERGRAARAHIARNYSLDVVAKRYETLFLSLAERGGDQNGR